MVYCQTYENLVGYVSTRDLGMGCVCSVGNTHVATGTVGGSVGIWDIRDYLVMTPNMRWLWQLSSYELKIRGSEYGGHNAAVWNVFYSKNNGRLYSVALDNVFKVPLGLRGLEIIHYDRQDSG